MSLMSKAEIEKVKVELSMNVLPSFKTVRVLLATALAAHDDLGRINRAIVIVNDTPIGAIPAKLRRKLLEALEGYASHWQDNDSPQAETTFGVHTTSTSEPRPWPRP